MIVTVAGSPVEVYDGSLSVDDRLGTRSVARFTVQDNDRVLAFARGQLVTISDVEVVWSGYVDSSELSTVNSGETWRHQLTCIDHTYLADKRIAARSYDPPVTVGDIVQDLWAEYLDAEGVTLGTVAAGPSLDAGAVISYEQVSAALDTLASRAGDFIWRIDQNKMLTFGPRDTLVAPWMLTGDDARSADGSVTVGNPDYRNVEYVVGGQDLTDPQTETFKGDGEASSFTVGFPIGTVPTVKVNGVPKTVGIKGVDDPAAFDWYWNKDDPTVTQKSSASELTSSDTLTVIYRGLFSVIAQVVAPAAIADTLAVEGGSGIVEHMTVDSRSASRDAAMAAGRAALDAYGVVGRQLRFTTRRPGLAAGQMLTVDLPHLGLSGVSMLIESVSISDLGGKHLLWSVAAVDGPTSVPWVKILGPAAEAIDDLVSIGGSVLVLAVTATERTNWIELAPTPSTQACPVFDTVFPPDGSPIILC